MGIIEKNMGTSIVLWGRYSITRIYTIVISLFFSVMSI